MADTKLTSEPQFGQRALMRRLFLEFGGDREKVLAAYEKADRAGSVRRSRNASNTNGREYAIRLWANGMNQGWLSGETSQRSIRTPGKQILRSKHSLFEEPLVQMGMQWREDPSRPRPTEAALEHWSELIEAWIEDESLPLLIRKSGHRAILEKLPSGRCFVRCDNSPAHWAFMGCYAGELPSLNDVSEQLSQGQLPLAMARARNEKALIESGTHTSFGGFIGSSKYGQVNKFTNGQAYKLCHLRAVGLGSRGDVPNFSEASLKRHMRLLLNPANMIVVPLLYSGVGECEAFLRAFLDSAEDVGSYPGS